jgi:hypothetical protein
MEAQTSSKLILFSVLMLVVLLLSVVCLTASVTHAEGAAGQWPVSSPENPTGRGGDGISTIIKVATLMQLIL